MSNQRRNFQIATVPGDGIGKDVTASAIKVLKTLSEVVGSFHFIFEEFDWSSENYLKRGYYTPKDDSRNGSGIEGLKRFDAILFGACGWPDVPDHISLWQMILPIRTTLNQYANVRPTRILKGTTSPLSSCAEEPSKLDWVIVRENSEGEYSGHGGTTPSTAHASHTVSTEVAIFTRQGIERIMRFAFEVALSRPRKKLTMVTKSNAQRHGMVLWDKVFYEVAKEYEGKGLDHDKMLVDAMTVRMVNKPESLDTIVATNLHADILSDLAAALGGSIGIAPSSNLDPTRQYPSMFEPIHGSAPDIAGQGIANPVGAFWSAAEMVRWLGGVDSNKRSNEGLPKADGAKDGGTAGLVAAADMLMHAVENVTGDGTKTKDLGGSSSTDEVTEAVCNEIKKLSTTNWKYMKFSH